MSEPWKPNVTVAAVVVGRGAQAGRYLVVEEETNVGLRINQPAGHLDPGEGLVDAVIRETLEETAHRFVPDGLLGIYLSRVTKTRRDEPRDDGDHARVTYLRFTFVGHVDDGPLDRPLDDGIVRALWMTADELRACGDRHRSPMVMRSLDDHLAGRPLAPLALLTTDPSALGSS